MKKVVSKLLVIKKRRRRRRKNHVKFMLKCASSKGKKQALIWFPEIHKVIIYVHL